MNFLMRFADQMRGPRQNSEGYLSDDGLTPTERRALPMFRRAVGLYAGGDAMAPDAAFMGAGLESPFAAERRLAREQGRRPDSYAAQERAHAMLSGEGVLGQYDNWFRNMAMRYR